MLSQAQRTTILELNARQVSKREIARVMGISRVAVRKVLRSNSNAVPELHRVEKAEEKVAVCRQEMFPYCRYRNKNISIAFTGVTLIENPFPRMSLFVRLLRLWD